MSNKAVLLEKYRKVVEDSEPSAPLDYIQLRNREALREWRLKLALASTHGDDGNHATAPRRPRERLGGLLASLHLHAPSP
jgi:hypothetical protein